MKLPQKVHKISDVGIMHTKLDEKSKGMKKGAENIQNRGVIVWDLAENSTDILQPKKQAESVDVKKGQQESRKTEPTEWKSLKKVDYLRLETVLEEVQQSSEERISKKLGNCPQEEGSEEDVEDVDPKKTQSNIFLNVEGKEMLKEKGESEKKVEKETVCESDGGKVQETEKAGIEMKKSKGDSVTVAFSISKKGLIPSGKMEILPIFSNDRFQCSRDAISIGECEDLCGAEKHVNDKRKENKVDRPEMEKNEKAEVKSPPKSAPAANTSVLAERKLRFKAFTEKHMPQTHSHFVNSLLVLAPFSEERKNLLKEKMQKMNSAIEERFQLAEASTSNMKKSPTDASFVDEGGGRAFSFSSTECFNC